MSFIRYFIDNRKTVYLTFEVFWIVVFILQYVAGSSGAGLVQFEYVNF